MIGNSGWKGGPGPATEACVDREKRASRRVNMGATGACLVILAGLVAGPGLAVADSDDKDNAPAVIAVDADGGETRDGEAAESHEEADGDYSDEERYDQPVGYVGDSPGEIKADRSDIPGMITELLKLEKAGYFSITDLTHMNGYSAIPGHCAGDEHFLNSLAGSAHLELYAQYGKLFLADLPARGVMRNQTYFNRSSLLTYPLPPALGKTSEAVLESLVADLLPALPGREKEMAAAAIADLRHFHDIVMKMDERTRSDMLIMLEKTLDYKDFNQHMLVWQNPDRDYSCYLDFTFYDEVLVDGRGSFMGHRPLQAWYTGFWLRRWSDGTIGTLESLLKKAEDTLAGQ